MGEEFGIAEPKQEPSVPAPLDWGLLERTPNHALWQHYKSLIRLRKENAALTSDTFEVIAEQEERGIFAFRRWSIEEQDNQQGTKSIFVVVNLRDEAAPYVRFHAPSLEDGVWCEYTSGKSISISDGQFDSTLAPSEARIYLHTSKN
jgi:glycosidase